MALLFGVPGVGKSLLAVQIGDALARGRAIPGVAMRKGRPKVLYVDLILTREQFQSRYSRVTDGGRLARYDFSLSLYRESPDDPERLAEWIEQKVAVEKYRVVIIDDLSAVTRTDDGTRDTLRLLRRLKRLLHEYDVSIMVLADSVEAPHTRDAGEADLRRSRVLCSVADSVIHFERRRGSERRLTLTRSQSPGAEGEILNCELTDLEAGLPGFAFDGGRPALDEKERQRVMRVKEMRDAGQSFLKIGTELGVSKETARRLFYKWTPDLDGPPLRPRSSSDLWLDYDEAEEREASALYGFDTRPSVSSVHSVIEKGDLTTDHTEEDTEHLYNLMNIPFAAGLGRRSIYDLDTQFDPRGKAMFVETADDHAGKPIIWYTVESRTGTTIRHERKGVSIHRTRLRRSEYI